MHAPVTVGSSKDRSGGRWKVTSVSWNPTFNSTGFVLGRRSGSREAKIPAGRIILLGVVWIDINKPHFGLHGTPEPSTVGRTSRMDVSD